MEGFFARAEFSDGGMVRAAGFEPAKIPGFLRKLAYRRTNRRTNLPGMQGFTESRPCLAEIERSVAAGNCRHREHGHGRGGRVKPKRQSSKIELAEPDREPLCSPVLRSEMVTGGVAEVWGFVTV
jgi:hypothetical protein